MDTETFLRRRDEICRRLESRRMTAATARRQTGWQSLLGMGLLAGLRLALNSEKRSLFGAWVPRLLLGVGAPALFSFLRNGRSQSTPQSTWERLKGFWSFWKARA